jgi:hypothetical protein
MRLANLFLAQCPITQKEGTTMRMLVEPLRLACVMFLALTVGFAGGSSAAPKKAPPGKPPSTPGAAGITYSGRAFAAFVNLPTLGVGEQVVSDTGELPPSGGFQSASLASVALPGVLSAELLVASTSGANGVARSEASLAQLVVLPGQAAQVTASFVRAMSEATCNGVRGATEVVDLTLGGQAITVDPFAPNQRFEIPGVATLIVNEQTTSSSGSVQEITVNALHLTLATGDEVILSSAQSDVQGCPGCPPAPVCHDFVTGGGFITVGTGRANFGFNAGFKAGSSTPVGHFNYIDHTTGLHVKAISVTRYAEGTTGRTSRLFEGAAEIDGASGTYSVEVADHGEPGKSTDTFRIQLSTGYSASGPLAGGNIQLHKPCP